MSNIIGSQGTPISSSPFPTSQRRRKNPTKSLKRKEKKKRQHRIRRKNDDGDGNAEDANDGRCGGWSSNRGDHPLGGRRRGVGEKSQWILSWGASIVPIALTLLGVSVLCNLALPNWVQDQRASMLLPSSSPSSSPFSPDASATDSFPFPSNWERNLLGTEGLLDQFIDLAIHADAFRPGSYTDSGKDSDLFHRALDLLRCLYKLRVKELQNDKTESAHKSLESLLGHGAVRTDLREDLKSADAFVQGLARYTASRRSGQPAQVPPVNVLVVGGGPVGLLSALEASRPGAHVHVVEKREAYTRDIWFDLYPEPWYISQTVLRDLGYFEQKGDRKDWELPLNKTAYTVRALTLERFLAKVVAVLDIPIFYGTRYDGVCAQDGRLAALLNPSSSPTNLLKIQPPEGSGTAFAKPCPALEPPGGTRVFTFDLLVGADGSKGAVAPAVGLDYVTLESFRMFLRNKERRVVVRGLKQVSMLLEIKTDGDGRCPNVTSNDPYYVGFVVDGVTAVFKRFYYGHCQMQFLFSRKMGRSLLQHLEEEEIEENILPWNLILKVCRVVLERSFASVAELKKNVVHRDGRMQAGLFPISLRVADNGTTVLQAGRGGTRYAIVALVGDSLSTAHYRLGVGINTGFRTSKRIGALVQMLLHKGSAFSDSKLIWKVASFHESRLQSIIDPVLQLQASTMFYESYCNLLVFFDHESPSLLHAQRLYARRREPGEYDEIVGDEQLSAACGKKFLDSQIKMMADEH